MSESESYHPQEKPKIFSDPIGSIGSKSPAEYELLQQVSEYIAQKKEDAAGVTEQAKRVIADYLKRVTGKENLTLSQIEVTGGSWDRLRSTYTTHNGDITTEYRMPEFGGPNKFHSLRMVTERSYKTIQDKDGKEYQIEMVRDEKTNEWRQKTIFDKAGEIFKGVNTTGTIVEVREEGKDPSYKLILTKSLDQPLYAPKPPVILGPKIDIMRQNPKIPDPNSLQKA